MQSNKADDLKGSACLGWILIAALLPVPPPGQIRDLVDHFETVEAERVC